MSKEALRVEQRVGTNIMKHMWQSREDNQKQ